MKASLQSRQIKPALDEHDSSSLAPNPPPSSLKVNNKTIEQLEKINAHPQFKEGVIVSIIALADLVMMLLASFVASALYHVIFLNEFPNKELYAGTALVMSLGFVVMGFVRDRYTFAHFNHLRSCLWHDAISLNITLSLVLSVLFLTTLTDSYSRGTFVAQYMALTVAIIIGRISQMMLLTFLKRAQWIKPRSYLIVGAQNDVSQFLSRHHNLITEGERIAIYAFPDQFLQDDNQKHILSDDMSALLIQAREQEPDDIVLLLPWIQGDVLTHIVHELSAVPSAVHLVPDTSMPWLQDPVIEQISGTTTLQLARPPLTMRDRILKRAFDITASLSGLLLLIIPFAVIMAMIKLESKGTVLFRQRRHGFNQNEFRISKFRTMWVLEDGEYIAQAKQNDPRITKVGSFLRRTNLDEFPQLWNVLCGDMSLVGPRPHTLAHNRMYEEQIALYARRHNVKPGITGWAQVNGCRGETDTTDKMEQRLAYDLFYIDNWSFKLDMKILFLTFFSRKAFVNAL